LKQDSEHHRSRRTHCSYFWAGESAAWWIAWPSMVMILQLVNRLNTTKTDYSRL
jgi:hypothetical protein